MPALTRREFVAASAVAVSGGLTSPGSPLTAASYAHTVGANDRVRLAVMGARIRG
jgi:hypothetical protein